MLEHAYPRPDVIVFLDAPAEVLHARKGEGTVDLLEQRRLDYLELRDVVPDFVSVDATQPEDDVVESVAKLICDRGRILAYDLDSDPSEQHPTLVTGSADVAAFERFAQAHEAARQARGTGDATAAEQLRALGYIED